MKPQLLFVFFCFLSAQASPDLPIPELSFEDKINEEEDTDITCKLGGMADVEVSLEIKGNTTLTSCNQKKEEGSDKVMYTSKKCTVEVTKEMDKMEFVCEAYFKTQSKPEKMYLQRDPEFTDCPGKQVWIEGQESSFHCKATGHPLPTVTCAKGNDKFKEGEKYKALRNMTGTYSCIAVNFDRDSKSVEVSVQYKPEVLDIKVNPPLHNDGDKVTVTCRADGEPAPTYRWKTPSSDVQFSADNTTITITSMKGTHRGKYRCTASNVHGDHSLEQDLVLAVQPKISDIKVEPSMEVFEGDNVTISCVASGFPVPVLSWNYPNVEVEKSPNQRELKIWGLKKKHEGNYACTAQNKHGTITQSRQITIAAKPKVLSIIAKPSTAVSEGDNLTLTCVAQGVPRPTYSWQIPTPATNTLFSHDSSVITISAAKKVNGGAYTCIAENKHGQDTMNKGITVTEKRNSGHRVGMSVSTVLALLMFCLL
ncbi:intercellular adhesion molecule 5-like isoform X1 [Anomaloglossus baeobatrachus]|uniref:intercellular adhesion molecule 5-like isoform X1 n=1 Tax=Anomaloglossus baeobatrachus TaxID=238106 RepID=UPI003F4F8863